MAKTSIANKVEKIAAPLAEAMGYELVDVEFAKEHGSTFLRVFMDKPGGISLDTLEIFHKALLPKVEDLEYDYLEVSSPGLDRPLKKPRDFQKAMGLLIEISFYKAQDGKKTIHGQLVGYNEDAQQLLVQIGDEDAARSIPLKECAVVKPYIAFE